MTSNSNSPRDGVEIEPDAELGVERLRPAENGHATPEPSPMAVLEAERSELKDKLMRTLADMENLRRRTEREVSDARTYAVTNFARDMLNVADNIRRALDSVPADSKESQSTAMTSLIEGIELTERDFLKSLERYGVKQLDPEGSKFDPNMHQAMFEVPNPDVATGTVIQVIQTGYAIGERVLRPALVGVAKGGPKVEAAPAAGKPS